MKNARNERTPGIAPSPFRTQGATSHEVSRGGDFALRKTTIISTCLQMTERDAYLHGFLLYKTPRPSVRNVNWILSSDAITITFWELNHFFVEMRLVAYNIILLQVVRLFYLFIINDETQPLTPLSEGFLGKARLALHVSCLLMIRASCYISSKLPSLKYCMI